MMGPLKLADAPYGTHWMILTPNNQIVGCVTMSSEENDDTFFQRAKEWVQILNEKCLERATS